MFGRVEKINNRNPSFPQSQCDQTDEEPVSRDFHLRRSGREFLDALRTCAEMLSLHKSELTIDCPDLKLARGRVNRSLRELRGFRASSAIGFRTKIEAWLALEALFGEEDARVTAFTCELAKEAHPFFSPGGLSTIRNLCAQRGRCQGQQVELRTRGGTSDFGSPSLLGVGWGFDISIRPFARLTATMRPPPWRSQCVPLFSLSRWWFRLRP
jgi:hypothetical protein